MKRFILTLAVLFASSSFAFAQARPTATRIGDFQAGAYWVADYPDYTEHKFFGYGAYADLDITEHWGLEGEFRSAHDTTETIGGGGNVPQSQKTYAGGLRYHRQYGHFLPYGKALYGYGVYQYPPYPLPANQLQSEATIGYNMIATGAGVDYRMGPHLRARADFEYQYWFASPNPLVGYDHFANTGGLPNGLTPILYSVGLAWRFGEDHYTPRGGRRGMY